MTRSLRLVTLPFKLSVTQLRETESRSTKTNSELMRHLPRYHLLNLSLDSPLITITSLRRTWPGHNQSLLVLPSRSPGEPTMHRSQPCRRLESYRLLPIPLLPPTSPHSYRHPKGVPAA